MGIAYYCMDNPEHIFKGHNLDGVRCPLCNGLVNTKAVLNEEYERLPKYRELKKVNEHKKSIEIQLDMDTGKLQLKLKAIAKHASALADELEDIDNAWECPKCGHDSFTTLCSEVGPYSRCDKCLTELDELPTTEGSE